MWNQVRAFLQKSIAGWKVGGFAPSIAYVLMEFYSKDALSAVLFSLLLTVVFGLLLSIFIVRFFSFRKIAG
jgi:hypothetical protein